MAIYNEKLGEMTPDNLIVDPTVKQITGSVTVASGQGVLVRGTVVAESGGKAVAMNADLTPYGILTDAVDASAGDAVAEVYLTGKFNKGALKVAEGYTLTAEDFAALRNGGIFVENMI